MKPLVHALDKGRRVISKVADVGAVLHLDVPPEQVAQGLDGHGKLGPRRRPGGLAIAGQPLLVELLPGGLEPSASRTRSKGVRASGGVPAVRP